MPALISLGAEVVLRNAKNSRTMLLEDLYLDYMKKDMLPDEVVEAIDLPLPISERIFRCYKLSKRYDSDISAVFAAFSLSTVNIALVKPSRELAKAIDNLSNGYINNAPQSQIIPASKLRYPIYSHPEAVHELWQHHHHK